jgi:release factor glutamine methyltransferase
MGTGSGIQAITAKEITEDVTAADINPECLNLENINSIQSDLFNNIKESYDLILFNPPYLPEAPKEPKDSALSVAGGKKGHEIIERFLTNAKEHLKDRGRILLLYSSLSGDIPNIAKKEGYLLEILAEEPIFMERLFVARLTPKSL